MIVSLDVTVPVTPEMWSALRNRFPNGQRLAVAFMLSLDVDACEALLRGVPVDPDRLDKVELAKARSASLIRFVRPVDLLLETVP